CQENRVIVHRRQAASHGPVFAARQRYVEDVVVPPTVRGLLRDSAESEMGEVSSQNFAEPVSGFCPIRTSRVFSWISCLTPAQHDHAQPI
ncbi:hypothetical protein V2I80_25995, partial [Pseudomonas viridiflava]|uniref:hypothetical protein n=2 Tax=Pseudomonas viridiflava TaxID=33069 RepID=UPI002EB671F8|nr:hypothetical protein [Pseudomonas viridiflava]